MIKRLRVHSYGGISLIEILVAMGLLALIMTLLIQVLLPGLNIWKHARAVADIEQQCMVAEDRIARTVMATVGKSIQNASSPTVQAISMLGHRGTPEQAGYDTTTGDPVWRQVDLFYVRTAEKILYQTFWDKTAGPSLPYTFPAKPFALTAPQLITLAAGTGEQTRRLAEKVTKLSLTPARNEVPPKDSEGYVLRLTLTTSVPTGARSVEREVLIVPRLRERKNED